MFLLLILASPASLELTVSAVFTGLAIKLGLVTSSPAHKARGYMDTICHKGAVDSNRLLTIQYLKFKCHYFIVYAKVLPCVIKQSFHIFWCKVKERWAIRCIIDHGNNAIN